MAGLAGHAELEGLYLKVAHEGSDALGDGSEVVVVHLLVLGRVVSHQGAAREQQVGTGGVESLVDEEVLLLPAEVRGHLLHCRVEIMAYIDGGNVHSVEGTQQRSLVVECLARIGNKHGGDAERVVNDEDGAGGIPCRVATGLEGAADTARGERRGVGFLLDEQLARELLYHTALAVVLDERVVLLGGTLGQRLEPVCIVRHAILYGPLLHAGSHSVGHVAVEACTVVDDVDHLLVHVLRQVLVHLLTVEDLLSKILVRSLTGCFHVEGLLLECLADNLKS